MEPAYTVSFLTGVEREYTHGEAFVGIGVFTAHVDEVIPGNSELCRILPKIFSEETLFKIVMTCRYRSMDSIKRGCADHFKSYIEGQMVILHVIYETLEIKECRMSLIAMIKIGLDPKLIKHKHTADTKEIFLFDTVLPVAAIELVGNLAVELRVTVEVSIEQI